MIIASWNVNSIRARQERLIAWLRVQKPDVVCLQELKVIDDEFPFDALRQAGYNAAVFGQRSYNGVAILSPADVENVERGLSDDVEDAQSRFIAGTVEGMRILCAYAPTGQAVGSQKYRYKMNWFYRLRTYLKNHKPLAGPAVLCGDLNIAPEDRDVANPDTWEGSVLFNADMRMEFRDLLALGLVDTFRLQEAESGFYSWWDYRSLGFPRNDGLRIDHILATGTMASRCIAARIDREARKGKEASDHAPVVAVFE